MATASAAVDMPDSDMAADVMPLLVPAPTLSTDLSDGLPLDRRRTTTVVGS